ncbi:Proteasomal ATPase-associated factor 1 [Coelomomyces lativittatus]|nr:Proteasomal ATPase-associated factor 1 [Coelomomyces lativittatus]
MLPSSSPSLQSSLNVNSYVSYMKDWSTLPSFYFPTITIQPDWPLAIQDVANNHHFISQFWMSIYSTPSVHVTFQINYNPFLGQIELSKEKEIQLTLLDKHRLTCHIPFTPASMSYTPMNFTILAPFLTFKAPFHSNKVSLPLYSIDMNIQGTLYAGGSENGRIFIWNAVDGQLDRTLEGHLADVTQTKFFPSGQVLLSTSADMTARVWSMADGSCPRIFQGHRGRITDCGMLVRGKTVITCSIDGTVKIWESASASILYEWDLEDPIHALSLLEMHHFDPEKYPSAYQPSSSSFAPLFQLSYPYRANSLCFLSSTYLAVGYEDGVILIWNLIHKTPCHRAQVSTTPILQLQRYTEHHLVITTADGGCFVYHISSFSSSLHNSSSSSSIQLMYLLSGNELDPLYGLKVFENTIAVAGRDGEVRVYRL